MKRPARILAFMAVATLVLTGAGVTAALYDRPQDAVPIQDPPQNPPQDPPPAQPRNVLTPSETAPTGTPAPSAPVPVPLTPEETTAALNAGRTGGASAGSGQNEIVAAPVTEPEPVIEAAAPAPTEPEGPPPPRQRRRVAVIQAVDKVTAESMRFEVEVGGRPVAFKREMIFRVRACEVSSPEERDEEAAGYVEISIQPRGAQGSVEPRQIFRGWMFASSPGVSVLQHPVYDAWLVDCRA